MSRLSIPAGLLAGVLVAGLVLGGLVAMGPTPTPPPTPTPATVDASPTPAASASGAASPTVEPTGSVEPSSSAFHVGEPAPALVVPQVGGGTVDLANLRGQPVWVNFMATWCPPCQDELPLMSGYAARYADEGLVVIAVDVKEDEGAVATFAETLGVTFPVGLDGDGSVAAAWDAVALPVHFWVDADGVIRYGALGGIGPDVMAEGLSAIMPGVAVEP